MFTRRHCHQQWKPVLCDEGTKCVEDQQRRGVRSAAQWRRGWTCLVTTGGAAGRPQICGTEENSQKSTSFLPGKVECSTGTGDGERKHCTHTHTPHTHTHTHTHTTHTHTPHHTHTHKITWSITNCLVLYILSNTGVISKHISETIRNDVRVWVVGDVSSEPFFDPYHRAY